MRIEPVIWFALLLSTFIYAFMMWAVLGKVPHGPFDEAFRSPITITLYVMSLISFVAGTVAWNVMRRRMLRLRMILSMALYESCAIYGVMAAMLVRDWRLYLAPWALTLIGFIRVFPSQDAALDSANASSQSGHSRLG